MPTPEEKARELIDAKLAASGWVVQSYREMNLGAGLGLAVTEFPGAHGPADYLLYVDGNAIGVVEAKPVGHTLKGVEGQSASYSDGLPESLPAWRRPLPFQYESTGEVTQFTDWMEPDARSRDILARLHQGNAETFVSLATQLALGSKRALAGAAIFARIALAFDECTPFHSDRTYTLRSMERTHRWLDRCVAWQREHAPAWQLLYGIVQGGVHEDLRAESTAYVAAADVDALLQAIFSP